MKHNILNDSFLLDILELPAKEQKSAGGLGTFQSISMLISTDSLKITIDLNRFSRESVEKSLGPYQNNDILRIRFSSRNRPFSGPHFPFYHPPHNRQSPENAEFSGLFS